MDEARLPYSFPPRRASRCRDRRLIDLFSLALSHGLMMLAAWRLLRRPDLDVDPVPGEPPVA